MKKYLLFILIMAGLLFLAGLTWAEDDLASKLIGRILLQVESRGEAWYVNPDDHKRYYLARPDDAFSLMRNLGIGITNADLDKIPAGLLEYMDEDSDQDGLTNRLEEALGTDPAKTDTDNDGYDDKLEIENNYRPSDSGRLPIDENFAHLNAGKIFLQVESKGEAWYLNPADFRRYYLGRPADAFAIMKNLGLGITNDNIDKIPPALMQLAPIAPAASSTPVVTPPSVCAICDRTDADKTLAGAANAIRSGNKDETVKFFIPNLQKAIEYTMDFLDADGRLTLGNILSGSTLASSTDTMKVYSTEVYFSLGGYKVPVKFYIEKQPDDTWLLTNL